MSAARISSLPPLEHSDVKLLLDRCNELAQANFSLERERSFAINACEIACKERDEARARIEELERAVSVWRARYERIAP